MSGNDVNIEADVLVIGGGPAGTWAAYTAASMGVKVILADKGYCGSSGATAPSGTNLWNIHSESKKREKEIISYLERGNSLAERSWLERLINETELGTEELIRLGYPFATDEYGVPIRRSLQGPEYMRLMRRTIQKAGVKILDHSPALRLLADDAGVGGASGVRLQTGENWTVRSKAVIIATGGCAFLSKALGCNVLTGDGYLLAAEVGAELSGMEFSNEYGLSAAFSTVTKNFFFQWATFTKEDGAVIVQKDKRSLAKHMLEGTVYAELNKANEEIQTAMRITQPNFFVPFDRSGINPFQQRFPITLRLEGTVRGNGGINLVNDTCATKVPGLFAAGDAATREFVAGGTTGGGSINASWAMTSGRISGKAAALYTHSIGEFGNKRIFFEERGRFEPSTGKSLDAIGITRALQNEVIPFEKNLFRTEEKLQNSMRILNELWREVHNSSPVSQDPRAIVRTREITSMIATARWMYTSALNRKETRGMHKRDDYPTENKNMQSRLIANGIEDIHIRLSSNRLEEKGILL